MAYIYLFIYLYAHVVKTLESFGQFQCWLVDCFGSELIQDWYHVRTCCRAQN